MRDVCELHYAPIVRRAHADLHGITLGEIDSAGRACRMNHALPARRTAWDMPPDVVTTFNANIPQSIIAQLCARCLC